MKLFISLFLFLISFDLFADYKSLCADLLSLKEGTNLLDSIGAVEYMNQKLATPVDSSFVLDKINKKKWLIFDVRSQKSLHEFGQIGNTLNLASDKPSSPKNKFNLSGLLNMSNSKKGRRYLVKRNINKFKTIEDLKRYKYIVFCNGFGCHKSSYAACQLRSMGIPYQSIFISLGGAIGLIKAGASLR